jgi:hypothetical protein
VLATLLRPGDVVLAMGAGSISAIAAHELPKQLGAAPAWPAAASGRAAASQGGRATRVERGRAGRRDRVRFGRADVAPHVVARRRSGRCLLPARDRTDLIAFLRALPPDVPVHWSASAATCWSATAACAAS